MKILPPNLISHQISLRSQPTLSQPYRRVAAGLIFLLAALLAAVLFASLPSSPLQAALAQTDPVVVIEEPTLTPGYGGLCTTYWYKYTNERDQNAYLTLNVNNSGDSSNSGIWQPDLPQDGYYKVEAYIPDHPPANWDCTTFRVIDSDTAGAVYNISHVYGSDAITVSQDGAAARWLNLGEYPFRKGTGGSVRLTDLTTDTVSLEHWVSFSAVRFTWVRPASISYWGFLPFMRKTAPSKIELTSVWTADTKDNPAVAFIPGESIRLYVSGTNTFPTDRPARITFKARGPCGETTVFATDTQLETGLWKRYYTALAPSCLGVYTYNVQVQAGAFDIVQESPFLVNNAGSVVLDSQPAFDKCNIGTVAQMQKWWDSSPYYTTNLYIGGKHRGCANTGLNAFWVSEVSKQGWRFIPTWVGLQAPCSRFTNQFSYDTSVAFQQGRDEANQALAATDALGLGGSTGSTVIYYDMEATETVTTACTAAMKSFLSGWTSRLHERNALSGSYGAPCNSRMAEWATVPYPPDAVWIASWYSQPYQYNPNASVWNVNCVSNSLWASHQRLRQYTNSHTVTWGGVAFTIDSNIDDGPVSLLPAAPGLLSTENQPVLPALPPQISDMQLVAPQAGWALAANRLLWSTDQGTTWLDRTPESLQGWAASAFFLDTRQGWLVDQAGQGPLTVWSTPDTGVTWNGVAVPGSEGTDLPQLTFSSPQDGWLAVTLPSSSNFSLGRLFRTRDGGQTWQAFDLPTGGEVRFTDPNTGWLSGGPSRGDLWKTVNGGETWEPVALLSSPNAQAFYSLPVFTDSQNGLLAAAWNNDIQANASIYTTADSGLTWSLSASQALDPANPPTVAPVLSQADGQVMLLPFPGSSSLLQTQLGVPSLTAAPQVNLPAGISQLTFASPVEAWALGSSGLCSGLKLNVGEFLPEGASPFRCGEQAHLYRSLDGGQTWVEITPGLGQELRAP